MTSLIRSFAHNFWLKIALCALLFAGVGIFTPLALAETLQTINDTSVAAPGSGSFTQWGGQYLGTGLSDIFSELTLWGTFPATVGMTVKICEATSEEGFAGMGTGAMACPVEKANGSLSEAKTNEEFAIILSQTVTLDPEKHYAIDIRFAQCEGAVIYGSGSDDSYPAGTFGSYGYQTNYPQFFRTYTDPVKDIYFILGTGAPSYAIAITTPEDEGTISGDFPVWGVNLDVPELTDDDYYYLSIQYEKGGYALSDGIFTRGGTGSFGVGKTWLLAVGEWTATAYLYNAPNYEIGDLLASSDEINFTVEIIDESGLPLPPDIDCNSGNFIADGFCHIIKYLFIPSSESLNIYQNLLDPIENKAPFGYFTLLKNELAGLGESTPVFDLNVDGLEFFQTIRTGLVWIIWLWVGVGLFKRLAHLEI